MFHIRIRSITSCITVCFLTLTTGCGHLLLPETKTITLNTIPSSATVWIDSTEVGLTPMTLDISNREPSSIRFSKQGYTDETCNLTPVVNPAVLGGDIVTGILFGAAAGSPFFLLGLLGFSKSLIVISAAITVSGAIIIPLSDRRGVRQIPENDCSIILKTTP